MSASSRFVRPSKYRHVFCEAAKLEGSYTEIALDGTSGEHNFISGNRKFFAVSVKGGGGQVHVRRYEDVGRTQRGLPTISGHSHRVNDTKFNPFNDNILATSSDDGLIKLWNIPEEGIKERMTAHVQELKGHGKNVTLLNFHPTASHVLAAASRNPLVKIWDVENAKDVVTLSDFGGVLQDIQWDKSGKELATSCKDRSLKFWDIRSSKVSAEVQPHEGSKSFRVSYMHNKDRFLTTGFTRDSKRMLKIWDPKMLEKPLSTILIDQAAGVMIPFYDEDTSMLFLCGRGDGNVRYYELVDEAPYAHLISEYRTSNSAKGMCMLPKRACSAFKCEVARLLKLTKSEVIPLSFIVPRKDTSFQADIFPDTYAGKPALTAAEWLSGKNADPVTASMDPEKTGEKAPSVAFKPVAAPAPAPPAPEAAGGGGGGGGGGAGVSSEEFEAAKTENATLKKENADLKATIESLRAELEKLKAAPEEAPEAPEAPEDA